MYRVGLQGASLLLGFFRIRSTAEARKREHNKSEASHEPLS